MSVAAAVATVASFEEIKHDFALNWIIYASMPIIAAAVGWSTKIVAMEMLYRPLEFKGIGPIGWQGIVPRRAGKVGSKTIQLLTDNLLKPQDLLDDFDAAEALRELRGPIIGAVEEVAREIAEQVRPGLWDKLPEAGRMAVIKTVENNAPGIADNILAELRADPARYVDVQYLAVTVLVRNKEKLNRLMRGITSTSMTFVRRTGIYFGFCIGLVQMVAWALFHNPWIMPAFGFAVGFISDYIALNLLFVPREKKKFLGIFEFQGIAHANREDITAKYAKVMAEDLFAPDILFDAILHGPSADKLFSLITKEVHNALDQQTGIMTPLVSFALGNDKYQAMKDRIVQVIVDRLPAALDQAQGYAARALNLENVIIDKMDQLTNEQYESIMRPVFKDDEPLMISVGAVIGGLVGELQVGMIELIHK
jgi:uncharacterized membrane protein YheB (UPF0754 family)